MKVQILWGIWNKEQHFFMPTSDPVLRDSAEAILDNNEYRAYKKVWGDSVIVAKALVTMIEVTP